MRGLVVLAALAFAMFFDVLLAPGGRVLGAERTDMFTQFIPWREFGFAELARGNLALWNPHVFGGVPFFAGWQAALLYPPNWLFLWLPLPLAMNWTIALHVYLLGAFMFAWALERGLHPLAAFLCGAALMLSGPFFLHLYPGHIVHMAAMAWAPLVLLAGDSWIEGRQRRACLLGMFAVAMQILAGFPQYVFYSALAAGVYVLLRDARAIGGLAAIYGGGAALAAVQLLPGIDAAQDTLRDRPLPYEAASSFAFPPENLLTLLAPGFFGGFVTPYWGRWYEWETSLYFGAVCLALAAYGVVKAEARLRLPLAGAAAATFVLALGSYTPLYAALYEHVPVFGRFRGIAKFSFLTALFLVLLAGAGLDRLMRSQPAEKPLLNILGAAAVLALLLALAPRLPQWPSLMAAVGATGESFLHPAAYRDENFLAHAASWASLGMVTAAAVLAAALGIVAAVPAAMPRALALVALAVLELFIVGRAARETTDIARVRTPAIADVLARNPGDYRVINAVYPNGAMLTRGFDIWGLDQAVIRRYAELVFWIEGENPSQATQYASFNRFHPHLSLLRLRYIFFRDGTFAEARAAPMKRLELIGAHRVLAGRDAIFAAMAEPGFDPRREVILERAPRPPPVAAANPGTARITREGTDFLEIEAKLEVPSVLLVTDTWASGWRAVGYEVMPANYALRAIPLGAGSHRILLEYAPRAFLIGVWISVISWLLWIGFFSLRR